jgi:acyl dehydratase
MGAVHVRNSIVQRRWLRADEPLRIVAAASELREGEKGYEFDLVTRAFAGRELVWESTSTSLARRGRERGPKAPPAPLALEGPGMIEERWRVTRELARRYAWVSDDLNPIHLSWPTARLFGFSAPILHGMWGVGRLATQYAERVGGAVRFDCEFKKPILLPAEVLHRGWTDGGGFAVRLLDQTGTVPHLVGTLSRAD